MGDDTRPGRATSTRARLTEAAVELFEVRGYEQTTAALIAARAGVSEMTFFRHFGTKEGVLFDDPYDPMIVRAVAAQPLDLPPVRRVVEGLRQAWSAMSFPDAELVRRRVRVVSSTRSLRAGMWANMQRTEDGIVEQLVLDGTPEPVARMATAAVLAAVTQALLAWAADDGETLEALLAQAFEVVAGGPR
ncbi:TetR/AcrR family transcriptional regulator [Agromyces sp. H3Y2-19a]|uniref:TetR/AcrR family transcriptional regulator n=1 Tax=Agromyces TaxID=33877 RepID=UPI0023B91A10|nr:TetR/AcrR family transcriptional regulator [Agromyces chromiiresistens]MDF0515324.1 TetR/AcrR family transcriptional regulator [Agromyces chromiiresistens]